MATSEPIKFQAGVRMFASVYEGILRFVEMMNESEELNNHWSLPQVGLHIFEISAEDGSFRLVLAETDIDSVQAKEIDAVASMSHFTLLENTGQITSGDDEWMIVEKDGIYSFEIQ